MKKYKTRQLKVVVNVYIIYEFIKEEIICFLSSSCVYSITLILKYYTWIFINGMCALVKVKCDLVAISFSIVSAVCCREKPIWVAFDTDLSCTLKFMVIAKSVKMSDDYWFEPTIFGVPVSWHGGFSLVFCMAQEMEAMCT